jgi:hypothetical protein
MKLRRALWRTSDAMRFRALTFLAETVFAAVLTMNGIAFARNSPKHDCVFFAEASKHLGTTQCVRGTVLHVDDGRDGLTFLNFCKDAKACPFTVIVLPDDLRKVGDIRQLEGRQIEIKGTIEDHDGRAGIILRHTQQLGESAYVVVPPVPTEYDVERRGHYSAGRATRHKAKKKHTKQGRPVSIEDPEEPQ